MQAIIEKIVALLYDIQEELKALTQTSAVRLLQIRTIEQRLRALEKEVYGEEYFNKSEEKKNDQD